MKNIFYLIANAAETGTGLSPQTEALIGRIGDQILNPIAGLLIALGVLMFVYGLIEFIAGADNEDKRNIGKRHMVWGVVGLFIMVSVFGIMWIIINFWVGIIS